MTDPGRRYFGVAPLQRFRLCKSRSNRTQTFDRPFPPKMPKPTAHTGALQSRPLKSVFHRHAKRQEYENAASMFYPEWLTSTPPGSEKFPERMPETPGGRHGFCARNQYGRIRAIQNAARKIPHNVMPEQAARLRRAGHEQIVIAFANFFEDLIDHNAVSNAHFGRNTDTFEFLFLLEQIHSEFRSRSEQSIDILLQAHQVRVNGRRFGHHVQQRDRCSYSGSQFTWQLDSLLDEFLSASAHKKTFQAFAFADRHQYRRLNRFDQFIGFLRTPVTPGRSGPPCPDYDEVVICLRRLIENLAYRFAGVHDDFQRDFLCPKGLGLLLERLAHEAFVARLFGNAKERCFRLERTGQQSSQFNRLFGGWHSITADQNLHRRLQFVSGEQSINHDGCADQRQRHKSEPDFRTRKILRGDRADLRANGRTGVHDQGDQNVHVALHRVCEGSITGRNDDLKKIGADGEMRRNPENVNHRRHPNVAGAAAEKTAE